MSNSYPPSEKKRAELQRRDIFPRSPILESAAAVAAAALVVWFVGPKIAAELKLFASSSFNLSGDLAAPWPLFSKLFGYVVMILGGGAVARLLIIKCESRTILRWPEIGVGRIFDLGGNVSGFFGSLKRGVILTSAVLFFYLFILTVVLPSRPEVVLDYRLWGSGHLIIVVAAVFVFGAAEIFYSFVAFNNRYGMTREELIAEQQELRPEFRAELQGRLRDGE